MSDLNQTFLNEYIRLEKLCKDSYRCLPKEELRGVWNYTQDMKNTPIHIKRNIPDWDYHYRELERIRITKNKWSHEEDGTKYMPFTQDDIEYLRDSRESKLNQNGFQLLSTKPLEYELQLFIHKDNINTSFKIYRNGKMKITRLMAMQQSIHSKELEVLLNTFVDTSLVEN